MGLDAATESLRWGVNDLGGTLMEESISRMAGSYHGVKLDPERPDRGRPPRRPPGRRAHDAVRHPPSPRSGCRRLMASPDPRTDGPLGQHVGGDRVGRDRRALRGRGDARDRRAPRVRRRSRSRATTTRSCASAGCPRTRATPYRVTLDGEPVWPEPDSPFPPSTLRTHAKHGTARIVFGSCRTAYPHHPPLQPHARTSPTSAARSTRCARSRCGWRRPTRTTGRTRCSCSATRCTPTRCRQRRSPTSAAIATPPSRPARGSPTSRSTRSSTASRGPTRRSAGCSPPCHRR